MEPLLDSRPHSRACGWRAHPHGSACHPNCPTCHGTDPEPGNVPLVDSAWRVVNVWLNDGDEGDVDLDALSEAITALHTALETTDA